MYLTRPYRHVYEPDDSCAHFLRTFLRLRASYHCKGAPRYCVRLIAAKVHPSLHLTTAKMHPLRLPPLLECTPYSTPAFLNAEVAPLRFSTLKLPPVFLNAKV